MKKLRLEVEALTVETFDTVAAREGKGTVRGHDPSNQFTFCFTQPEQGSTCVPGYTCPECAYTLDPCPDQTLDC